VVRATPPEAALRPALVPEVGDAVVDRGGRRRDEEEAVGAGPLAGVDRRPVPGVLDRGRPVAGPGEERVGGGDDATTTPSTERATLSASRRSPYATSTPSSRVRWS
jgi:hypothetical protein